MLNPKLNTREQPEVLQKIEDQLVTDYPNIFSQNPLSGERLRYARNHVVRLHCQGRTKQGYAKKRPRKSDHEGGMNPHAEILDLTMVDDSDEELPLPTSKPVSQQGGNSNPVDVITTSKPSMMNHRTTSASISQSAKTFSVPAQTIPETPTPSLSHPPACFPSRELNTGLNHIHHFLKSCSPPLGHLLARFVDLGFKSVDILKEVSCSWTKDERLELLGKLRTARSLHGGEVSELELFALERRFRKYFLETSKGM